MSKVAHKIDLKIIILGAGRVGKTSFIHRYIHDEFASTLSTVGASFVLKIWKEFNFGIWDTAGQEKFSRISSYYTKGAQAAILAYDITDLESFQLLSNYMDFLKGADKNCWVILVGTKKDLVDADASKRQVPFEKGKAFADLIGAPFYETSAKTNTNVPLVFDNIGFHCLADKLAQASEEQRSTSATPANHAQLQNNNDSSCCSSCSIL